MCKTALGPDLDSPVWDRAAGLALAEEFVDADGLRPDVPPEWREQFVGAASGADALWRMTTVPLSGACPWHYPPGSFEPEFFEQIKEIRRAALS